MEGMEEKGGWKVGQKESRSAGRGHTRPCREASERQWIRGENLRSLKLSRMMEKVWSGGRVTERKRCRER